MAILEVHLEQGDHNRHLSKKLAGETPLAYKDWAVISAFYAAVHYFEAYMFTTPPRHTAVASKGKPYGKHKWRELHVGHSHPLSGHHFVSLYEMSMTLRYMVDSGKYKATATKGAWITDSDVRAIVDTDLEAFMDETLDKLAAAGAI